MEHIGRITQVNYNPDDNSSSIQLDGGNKLRIKGNYEKWKGHPLLKKDNGNLKIGKKPGTKSTNLNINETEGEPIGQIKGKTSTNEVEAKIKTEKEDNIKELDVVKIEHNKDIALGQVTEYTRDKNRNAIAKINIIGLPKKGRIRKVKVPFKQQNRIYKARFQELKEAMDLNPNGLYIGHMHNTNIPIRISLERFMQSHTAVFAKNRYGKTYTLRVLIEELINHGKPILVFDSRNEYIFSKENENKEEKEQMDKYNIQPTGYKNKYVRYTFREPERPRDVQLRVNQLENPELYTNYLIKPGQVNVFSMPSTNGFEEEKRIIATSLEKILELGKQNKIPPCFIIIEEGEKYVKQQRGTPRHIEAIGDIANQGAAEGINLGVVGHRMAKVEKDVLSQCHNHIIMHTSMDNDVRKIKKSVEGTKQYEQTIRGLPKGTAYITGMVERPLLVDIRPSKTHHYGHQTDVKEVYKAEPSEDIEKLRNTIQKL